MIGRDDALSHDYDTSPMPNIVKLNWKMPVRIDPYPFSEVLEMEKKALTHALLMPLVLPMLLMLLIEASLLPLQNFVKQLLISRHVPYGSPKIPIRPPPATQLLSSCVDICSEIHTPFQSERGENPYSIMVPSGSQACYEWNSP